MNKYEYKGISKRTQNLLNRIEDYDVEFKESSDGLDPEDIVAFANSDEGGTILIGIEEVKHGKYKGKGQIIGCSIGDREKRKIIDKAENCSPPVNIEIFVENLNKVPFYRIEILDNKNKPYSTLSGTYKIRGDGRNKALLPGRLLSMFIKAESGEFIERYKEATKEFELRMTLILKNIEDMSREFGDRIHGISEISEEASVNAEDAFVSIENVLESLEELDSRISLLDLVDELLPGIEDKLNAIIRRFEIEPMYSRIMKESEEFVHLSCTSIEQNDRKRADEIKRYIKSRLSWLPEEEVDEMIKAGREKFRKLVSEVDKSVREKKKKK